MSKFIYEDQLGESTVVSRDQLSISGAPIEGSFCKMESKTTYSSIPVGTIFQVIAYHRIMQGTQIMEYRTLNYKNEISETSEYCFFYSVPSGLKQIVIEDLMPNEEIEEDILITKVKYEEEGDLILKINERIGKELEIDVIKSLTKEELKVFIANRIGVSAKAITKEVFEPKPEGYIIKFEFGGTITKCVGTLECFIWQNPEWNFYELTIKEAGTK